MVCRVGQLCWVFLLLQLSASEMPKSETKTGFPSVLVGWGTFSQSFESVRLVCHGSKKPGLYLHFVLSSVCVLPQSHCCPAQVGLQFSAQCWAKGEAHSLYEWWGSAGGGGFVPHTRD